MGAMPSAPQTPGERRTVAQSGQSSIQDTKKDLPIELWMQILDIVAAIPDSRLLTRPHVVLEYEEHLTTIDLGFRASNTGEQTDHYINTAKAELGAAMIIQRLERRSWLLTRAYYQINTRIRAAAVKLRLSSRLLTASRRVIYTVDHQRRVRPRSVDLASCSKTVPRMPPCTVFELPPWPLSRSRDEYLKSFRLLFKFLEPYGIDNRKTLPPFIGTEVGEALFFQSDVKILVPGVHWEDYPGGCPRAYRVALARDVARMLRELWTRHGRRYACEHCTVEVI